jgi:proton-dependent oligopeptide transporter, POT family
VSAAPGSFLGHPAGFSTLFFTELWERFSYYGMRAFLVLFLVDQINKGGLGLDDTTATAIYGLYTAGVYIASMPGGWISDRLIGAQSAVLWGGLFITTGHVVLAVANSAASFLLGLGIIVIGTGLLKPNVNALVAQLYPQGGARRDSAFTLFYMAINLGAVLGPFAAAGLAARFGWHYGFLAAAVGMALGVCWFQLTRHRLGETGRLPAAALQGASARDWRILGIVAAAVATLALLLWSGTLHTSAVALRGGALYLILALVIAYFIYLLFLAGLTRIEKRGVIVLLFLFMASVVFWAGYEQAGSSLTLFAERHTNRLLGGTEFPAGWFQSVPAVFVILFAPMLAALWVALDKRGRDLSLITKFSLGVFSMGLGFLVMVPAAKIVSGGALAGPFWLVLTYLLHTWGELVLSPVGLSATSRLVPSRFIGQSMGLWFASLSLGNLVASRLAAGLDSTNPAGMPAYFTRMFWIAAIAAALLMVTLPFLRGWAAPPTSSDPPR